MRSDSVRLLIHLSSSGFACQTRKLAEDLLHRGAFMRSPGQDSSFLADCSRSACANLPFGHVSCVLIHSDWTGRSPARLIVWQLH